jgi:prepilin-type N-terminal cleavage/methylation domain-containing protein
MPRPTHKAASPAGMTLIELLVAISISTLILTIALSVYFTFSNSLNRQKNLHHQKSSLALDTLRHDIASSVQAYFSNSPTFELTSEPVGIEGRFRSTLTFHTAKSPPGDQGLPQMTISRLRYSLNEDKDSSTPDASSLIRESVTLWGPDALAPPISNSVLKGISNFEVRVLDKKGWTNVWKSTPGHLLPRASRVLLEWQEANTSRTSSLVIFIPAGNGIAPSRRQTNNITGQTTPSRADNAAPTPTRLREN